MKKFLLLTILLASCFGICKAQGFGYDAKTDIGNGLYKVKSGEYYGIIDKNDNVVVSIEFQDILFKNGKALLTKNDILYGVVDSLGRAKVLTPNIEYIQSIDIYTMGISLLVIQNGVLSQKMANLYV